MGALSLHPACTAGLLICVIAGCESTPSNGTNTTQRILDAQSISDGSDRGAVDHNRMMDAIVSDAMRPNSSSADDAESPQDTSLPTDSGIPITDVGSHMVDAARDAHNSMDASAEPDMHAILDSGATADSRTEMDMQRIIDAGSASDTEPQLDFRPSPSSAVAMDAERAVDIASDASPQEPSFDAAVEMDAEREMDIHLDASPQEPAFDADVDIDTSQEADVALVALPPEPAPIACEAVNELPPVGRGDGQLRSPVTPQAIGQDPAGRERFLRVQTTPDQHLLLPVNASFFTQGSALVLGGQGIENLPSAEALNRSRTYAYAERWNRIDEGIMWGVNLQRAGALTLEIDMGVDPSMAEAEVEISLGEHRVLCTTESTGGVAERRILWRIEFEGIPGQHILSMRARHIPGDGVGRVYQAHLTGPGAEDAQLIRARWRPGAVHSQWRSQTMENPSRLWVIELEPQLNGQGFYAPITTQFGYFGSARADDGEITGLNFSMWSFGRGQDEPPIERLSHIVGIGHPDGQFGGFDHEGTGAKVRGWNPYAGLSPATQTLALRVEPGDPYDTFYGYFLAPDTRRWTFFAAGKKFNDGHPLESLTAGAFVEVAGPPQRQRTGQWERRVRYRGWYRDSEGVWHTIDTQQTNGSEALINKRWGIDGHQHWMSMGGLVHWQDEPGIHRWVLPNPPSPADGPEYIQEDAIAALDVLPARLEVESAGNIQARSAIARFSVHDAGTNPRAQVFWGTADALTFADRWQNNRVLDEVLPGMNTVVLDGLNPATRYAYRVLISNDEGHMWTLETGRFETLP